MPRLCERPGCSAPADVAYGFDAESLVVWLDTFDAAQQGPRSGGLCRRHANAMVVPLGWMLDDRREPVPRLFTASSMDDLTDGMVRPRHRGPRPDKTLEVLRTAAMQLSLDDVGAGEAPVGEITEVSPSPLESMTALIADPATSTVADEESPPAVEPEQETAPELETATEPEPEIELEPEQETAPELDTATEPEPEPEAEIEPEPEADVLPWQPRFDQNDDLSGLLKARGRLLSRAFRGVTADGA